MSRAMGDYRNYSNFRGVRVFIRTPPLTSRKAAGLHDLRRREGGGPISPIRLGVGTDTQLVGQDARHRAPPRAGHGVELLWRNEGGNG